MVSPLVSLGFAPGFAWFRLPGPVPGGAGALGGPGPGVPGPSLRPRYGVPGRASGSGPGPGPRAPGPRALGPGPWAPGPGPDPRSPGPGPGPRSGALGRAPGPWPRPRAPDRGPWAGPPGRIGGLTDLLRVAVGETQKGEFFKRGGCKWSYSVRKIWKRVLPTCCGLHQDVLVVLERLSAGPCRNPDRSSHLFVLKPEQKRTAGY